jgi:hypothetical protein
MDCSSKTAPVPTTAAVELPGVDANATTNSPLSFMGGLFAGGGFSTTNSSEGNGLFSFNTLKFVALIAFSMLAGSLLTKWLATTQHDKGGNNIAKSKSSERRNLSSSPAPVATLVNVANCRWDQTYSTADIRDGGKLGPGQSLCLLEGVAEVDCTLPRDGNGTFQLEGPLSMMLNSEGMPTLQFGKLAAQISGGSGRYAIDTPMGRVIVPYDASIGIISNTNDVEMHVFDGEAMFEPLWPMAASISGEPMICDAGSSLRITPSGNEGLSLARGRADAGQFASRTSMTASRLEVSDKYVAAVRRLKPLAYWRFEREVDGSVPNEMGDEFDCRIYGTGITWHSYLGNRSIEFGSSANFGCLMTDEVLDGYINDSYTFEAWVKPSHFHHGAVISLVESAPQTPRIAATGMLLELCGPVAGNVKSPTSWAYHPGRIRYLHRTPAGEVGGHSCFSESRYAPRRWQYLVGTKSGAEMRLYIDGKVAATDTDSTRLADGMHVLIGQLHPHDSSRVVVTRPLVGELDEVAIYDRALTEKEIIEHYQLARPIADIPPKSFNDF